MKLQVLGTLTFLLSLISQPLHGYSVLTHEQVVDMLWDERMLPLLKQRFPNASVEELKEAHANAYGGSVIQDLGYYPFGNKLFSNLVHYVRSGDFVSALIHDASTVQELGFALGALAHYTSDCDGHPAVNRAVAMMHPELKARFGDSVTYDENPVAHLQTEFSFDVVQVAKQRYTGDRYHDFIGFKVADALLERAFLETYGIALKEVLTHKDLVIGTYRRSISEVVPEMTRVALLTKQVEFVQEKNDRAKREFLYHLSRADYEKEWGNTYRRPGFGARLLAFLVRILPKVGPLKALHFRPPTGPAESLFLKSIDTSVDQCGLYLKQEQAAELKLRDRNLDTGALTARGSYGLQDRTYADLLHLLAKDNFVGLTPELQNSLLAFYSSAPATPSGQRKKPTKSEREVPVNLEALKKHVAAEATHAAADLL